MLTIALALTVLAAAPIQKIEKIQLEKQTLDFKLPAVPKADGLSAPSKTEELETKRAAGDLSANMGKPGQVGAAKVESVKHARDFQPTKNGYRPVNGIEGFTVNALPTRVTPFKTCVRIGTPDGVPVVMKTSIKSPGGAELMASRADVSFAGANAVDVIIEWDGFEASQAGEYKIAVLLDGKPSGEYPLKLTVPGAKE